LILFEEGMYHFVLSLLIEIEKGLTRGKQQDAEEFVSGLLDNMESDLLANFPK